MHYKGQIKVDRRTKNLVKRLLPNDIAVIDHQDIDEVSARSLIDRKVKIVLNAQKSISGRYPNPGPLILERAGVLIIDNIGNEVFAQLKENDTIEILDDVIHKDGKAIGKGIILTEELILKKMDDAKNNFSNELDKFVQNTLEYAKKEKELIIGGLQIPDITSQIYGKHVLIVVRGANYKEDLKVIKSYIEEEKPVLIGVDGGADALKEFGYLPQIIIGDMDSITDETLKSGAEIIVHAYPDGRAPGLSRIEALGLKAKIFSAPGTSEDIAMLLAFEKGASLIVAVGTHSNMIDFLEKGRKGMASTFLVRLKVGSILVDARGVAQLYRNKVKMKYIIELFIAALIPIGIIAAVSPPIQQLMRLLLMKLRLMFGF
jgi:uncharacterized membrane-anchored protein